MLQIQPSVSTPETVSTVLFLPSVPIRGKIGRVRRQVVNRFREMIGQKFKDGVVGHIARMTPLSLTTGTLR